MENRINIKGKYGTNLGIDQNGNVGRINDHTESYRKILESAQIHKGLTDSDKAQRRAMVREAWEEYANRSLDVKDIKLIYTALQSKRKGFRLTKDAYLQFSNKMVQDDGKIQTDDYEIKTSNPYKDSSSGQDNESDLLALEKYIKDERKRRKETTNV